MSICTALSNEIQTSLAENHTLPQLNSITKMLLLADFQVSNLLLNNDLTFTDDVRLLNLCFRFHNSSCRIFLAIYIEAHASLHWSVYACLT